MYIYILYSLLISMSNTYFFNYKMIYVNLAILKHIYVLLLQNISNISIIYDIV